jgi:hypothetical protein
MPGRRRAKARDFSPGKPHPKWIDSPERSWVRGIGKSVAEVSKRISMQVYKIVFRKQKLLPKLKVVNQILAKRNKKPMRIKTRGLKIDRKNILKYKDMTPWCIRVFTDQQKKALHCPCTRMLQIGKDAHGKYTGKKEYVCTCRLVNDSMCAAECLEEVSDINPRQYS